jgi:alpha-galactosidase
MLSEAAYKGKIDSFVRYSKYTLVYLTQRDGCDFYDTAAMHPVFRKLVAYAHSKGLKIGLQIWKDDRGVRMENTDRLMQEGEVVLDGEGKGSYSVKAMGARNMNTLLKSGLFKVYAFKKTGDGFYDPKTLHDITATAKGVAGGTMGMDGNGPAGELAISIAAGGGLKGYTAYILTQHYYHSCSNFSRQAKDIITGVFRAYGDVPFDALGLDEYKNMTIARQKVLDSMGGTFRERLYSLGMAERMKVITGMEAGPWLLAMRYVPEGDTAVRIRTINEYMRLLRTATLGVEAAVYDLGKKEYGPGTFIGLHDTYHNNLDKDEVWQTGVSWWNIKRDYGHTDEETITPIQLGIGMCYRENALYNMYYNKSLDRIWTKALYDLRYGVRTHYHAANDVDGWGVSIDQPAALEKINKVENAARLLNRFDPPFPGVKLLVVYGMEALFDWYPDAAARGTYDINESLKMDRKSKELWDAGYLHAAVPTDVIEDGRLTLNAAGKPVLNGYVFDAVIFLYPQYAPARVTDFFRRYVDKGGKLLIEGPASRDFYGKDMSGQWAAIRRKAVAGFSMENVKKLGIAADSPVDGVVNEDGSYTFTNEASLRSGTPANFTFSDHGHVFSGSYKGLAAIKVDANGRVQKLAATGFSSLSRDGKEILRLPAASDIFIKGGDTIVAGGADAESIPAGESHTGSISAGDGGTAVWLDSVGIKSFSEGIPAVVAKTSAGGDMMRIGGVGFSRGVGVQTLSVLSFFLDGKAGRFTARAGVDDASGPGAAVRFFVIGDRKILFESGVMKAGDVAGKVDIDLRGVKRLGLLVTGEGNNQRAYADWADARLLMQGSHLPEHIPNTDEKYILTPPVGKAPAIHSAGIFGARPGNPFLFTVATTGERPMRWSAEGLPKGLSIDAGTGIITGRVDQQGEYVVVVRAKNASGEARKECRFRIGDAIALTPPMGWNGWNSWAREIDREKVIASARAMVSRGLSQHGWTYINIDDAWQGQRGGSFNALQPNEKFPGFEGMVDTIHGLGLKIGLYSTPWISSYAGYPGGSSDLPGGLYPDSVREKKRMYRRIGKYRFEENDARQMAVWGIDYLKYDWRLEVPSAERMSAALRQSGRDIVYSLSNSAPYADAADWARISNTWRTGPDIRDSWTSLFLSAFSIDKWGAYGGPGHWNDPDMLIVGNVSTGSALHPTRLTPDEQYSHVSLFCLLSAPLIIGCPIEQLDAFSINLLSNDEVIGIDQDPLGKPARLSMEEGGVQVWVKQLGDGSYAVGLFNIDGFGEGPDSYFRWGDEKARSYVFDLSKAGLKGKWRLRDVWRQKDLGSFEGKFATEIRHHGVVLLRMDRVG